MHHPIPCLSGTFSILKVRKGSGTTVGSIAGASGGQFWHGFAVRLAACKDARVRIFRIARTSGAEEMRSDPDHDTTHLLSPEEIARFCGLSRRAVYRAISRGELRAARLCNRLRIAPAELERWIGEQAFVPELPVRPPARTVRPTTQGGLRALLDGISKD